MAEAAILALITRAFHPHSAKCRAVFANDSPSMDSCGSMHRAVRVAIGARRVIGADASQKSPESQSRNIPGLGVVAPHTAVPRDRVIGEAIRVIVKIVGANEESFRFTTDVIGA